MQILQTKEQRQQEIVSSDLGFSPPHVFVVLPCYNEEQNISRVVNNISTSLEGYHTYEIIAVNDGSSDLTKSLLQTLSLNLPVRIISHSRNMGLSSTLDQGLAYATSLAQQEDIIVTMDADDTHDTKYIQKMVAALDECTDFVIASRYAVGGMQIGVPNNRILLSKGVNFLIRTLSGLKVRDTTSGYRCYKASLLKRAGKRYDHDLVSSKGFEIQVELLVKLGALSNGIKEIPFILRYDRKRGKSKMPILKTIRDYIVLSFKILSWRA